jgi:hypothetical protein
MLPDSAPLPTLGSLAARPPWSRRNCFLAWNMRVMELTARGVKLLAVWLGKPLPIARGQAHPTPQRRPGR